LQPGPLDSSSLILLVVAAAFSKLELVGGPLALDLGGRDAMLDRDMYALPDLLARFVDGQVADLADDRFRHFSVDGTLHDVGLAGLADPAPRSPGRILAGIVVDVFAAIKRGIYNRGFPARGGFQSRPPRHAHF
jgi:hypothetical protein